MYALSNPAAFEPVIDPHDVLLRAKAIFADSYHYPAIPFWSIGRPCFAWARIEARRRLIEEARERARLDSMSLDDLRGERARLYDAGWRQPISRRGNEEMTRLWDKARKFDAEISQRIEDAR